MTNIRSGASPFHIFCRFGDHNFQNVCTFKPFIASNGRLTAATPNAKRSDSAPGLAAGQSASHTRPTISSGDPHFHGRARSRAPHFHARARSGAPHVYFAMAHTYQNLGWVPPPPTSLFSSQRNYAEWIFKRFSFIENNVFIIKHVIFKHAVKISKTINLVFVIWHFKNTR